MAKKFILKSLDTTNPFRLGGNRPFEKNLLNLSAIGIKWNSNLIKQIRSTPDYEYNNDATGFGNLSTSFLNGDEAFTRAHENVAGNNKFVAFYDKTYQMRRDFLRKFALQGEIDYVLETISDEVIINDDMHYFAYPNTNQLRTILKPEHGKKIVNELNNAYRRIYHMFHFNESNDAWHYVKKFLVDGFLAFEIIFSDNKKGNIAEDIIGFKELDPILMQPEIRLTPDGHEYKIWIINKGDKQNERELLDTHVIYISWAKNNFVSHFSYCERLIRSFNMLRTIENSRLVWNIQNAQKRMKIVVPIGSEADQIAQTRLRALEAYYKEDIAIDNYSGELTVNGSPKFNFTKTMVFPSRDGAQTDVSELEVAGHDMSNTDQLSWFWQRFLLETRIPKDRFNLFFNGSENSALPESSTMTREEYRYSLFIDRIRNIFKEVLIKPMWIQFCLHNPQFANNDVLKNALGLSYTEDNVFAKAKENTMLQTSTNIINTLSGLQDNNEPVFPMRYLLQKYLDITDDEWKLINKMKEDDKKKQADEQAVQGGAGGQVGDMGGGDFGGDFGGGDFGGGDFGGGGDMGGGPDLGGGGGQESGPQPEPAPQAGGGEPMA